MLLHGDPRTLMTWRVVAPALAAAGIAEVCRKLRGYGQSSTPEPDPGHPVYSNRAMAKNVARLMSRLGHERFAAGGHDRGSYVGCRTALNHPERVSGLAALDGVPSLEAVERGRPIRAEVVAPVLLRLPEGRTGHHGRPAGLVPARPGTHGRGQPRGSGPGHHISEDNPEQLSAVLTAFLHAPTPKQQSALMRCTASAG
ncbi:MULTISPECIES: alpha/beta fold hydrolase [Micrococcus]|uniref:alpha/beta fold hydrolase n=2 Tax=Micrococcus TaxID=1269 RepID=UPI001ABC671E